MTKARFLSAVLWLNVATFAVALTAAATGAFPVWFAGYATAMLAAANLVLRLLAGRLDGV